MYTSTLGDNAIKQHVMFLTSLKLTADINECQLALTCGTSNNIATTLILVLIQDTLLWLCHYKCQQTNTQKSML